MTSPPKKTLRRTNRFARDLKPIPEHVKTEAFETAQRLCETVFHRELDVRPLTGLKGYFGANPLLNFDALVGRIYCLAALVLRTYAKQNIAVWRFLNKTFSSEVNVSKSIFVDSK